MTVAFVVCRKRIQNNRKNCTWIVFDFLEKISTLKMQKILKNERKWIQGAAFIWKALTISKIYDKLKFIKGNLKY